MKPRPKATYHHGTCQQCAGEGDVLTIAGDPVDLSLCGDCLALPIANATGIRSAIRERWAAMSRRRSVERQRQRADLGRKAQEDLELVEKMDEENGRGVID
jgi:hypothetical protein